MQNIVVSLISFYQKYLSFDTGVLQVLAPGGACKYEVRCSEYTKQMIIEYGVISGMWMGFRRILSCR